MSTLYTCHGKDCPLKAHGLYAIIDPKDVRYKLTITAEHGADERSRKGYDLCAACALKMYEMLES